MRNAFLNKKIELHVAYLYQALYGVTNKVEKKILFDSMAGKQYSCNPRAISEKMHELYPDYSIVWWLDSKALKNSSIPPYIKTVTRYRDYLKEATTSFAVISNDSFTVPTYKRKNQFFVQTWHGDRGYKKVLYEAWEDGKRPLKIADDKVTDLYIAGSKYGEQRGRSSFHYNGRILNIGMPRNDRLANPSTAEIVAIKNRIGVAQTKKILLYAPTFRDNLKNEKQQATVDIQETLKHLNSHGEEWVCLYRAHPASKGLEFDDAEGLIDATHYPDMADLLIIADMLLTDYSGCAGDYILRKKPTLFAMFDLDEYKKNCRDFRFEFEDAGFLIAKSQEELNRIIDAYSDEDYEKNCEQLVSYFGINETGKSAEEICRIIDENYKKKVTR